MEKAKVYYSDLRTSPTSNLLDKMERLLKRAGIEQLPLKDSFAAIKIHFGEPGNLAYLRPNWAKTVADFVRERGGKPFLTDTWQRPEGGGYGVPLNYVWDEADAIYIHCAPEGRKLHCLRECDRVTFCIVGKTQVLPARFTTFYESILLDCRARTGLTAEERRRALDHLIGKYSPEYKTIGRQYVEKSFHRTEIIRLDILSWSGKCKDNLHPGTTPPGANSNRT